jgi:hypothetical protein
VATDNGVLSRTLNQAASPEVTYRPYVWRQSGREISAIFRDHYLSDLIGFVYSKMDPASAASHFIQRIHENCGGFLASGRDALVPVILDGENAWEHYDRNGRPFLRELYRRISEDPSMRAVTVSEGLRHMQATPLDHIFPGSWINSNFDVWIGSHEDNRAWEFLLEARRAYRRVVEGPDGAGVSEADKALAREELLISEGSDWCWWYGPEHDSPNRPEFDQLYRDHLANMYRALGLTPPEELSRPILKTSVKELHDVPTGSIRATVDGEVTSYFEWLGAGTYRVDGRQGAMHGHRYIIRELRYGSDGEYAYFRLDLQDQLTLSGMEARFSVRSAAGATHSIRLSFSEGDPILLESTLPVDSVQFAYKKVLELRVPLEAAGIGVAQPLFLQVSVWQGGLPMDAFPTDGWIECATADSTEWLA